MSTLSDRLALLSEQAQLECLARQIEAEDEADVERLKDDTAKIQEIIESLPGLLELEAKKASRKYRVVHNTDQFHPKALSMLEEWLESEGLKINRVLEIDGGADRDWYDLHVTW